MRFLLDTHTFLWFIADSSELSKTTKALLEDGENDLFLSYASIWEIAIKYSLGKLDIPQPLEKFISEQLSFNGIELFPITLKQISAVAALPFHHRDPFDRLLIAQAQTENFQLVSRDESFDLYGVKRFW